MTIETTSGLTGPGDAGGVVSQAVMLPRLRRPYRDEEGISGIDCSQLVERQVLERKALKEGSCSEDVSMRANIDVRVAERRREEPSRRLRRETPVPGSHPCRVVDLSDPGNRREDMAATLQQPMQRADGRGNVEDQLQ